MQIENGRNGKGFQVLRTTIDALDKCNLACLYCHPSRGRAVDQLSAMDIQSVMKVINDQQQLQLTLSGGEITLHPEWEQIMEDTHLLKYPSTTIITNGTTMNGKKVNEIRKSNVFRVCTSIDGPNAQAHEYARGKGSFEKATRGLRMLRDTGKNITVISVVHQGNIEQLMELSEFLAKNKLADQHHMAVISYSGKARDNVDRLIVPLQKVLNLQNKIDHSFSNLQAQGLFVMMSSYWPITGNRARSDYPRNLTIYQITEQVKDTYAVVRPNGDVRMATTQWGRNSVAPAVIGNISNGGKAVQIFAGIDEKYRQGDLLQLPREMEAQLKFVVVGVFDNEKADLALDFSQADLKPVQPLSEIDLLSNSINKVALKELWTKYTGDPSRYRLVKHATGVYLFYDKVTDHVVLLKQGEVEYMDKIKDG
jgi:MoaA/NifB/PqqE/SkfB family radical SAM enzyme